MPLRSIYLDIFVYWLFLFFMFSVMGWVLECIIESVNHRRPINRGFLRGPYIPIYGYGGVLFALVGIPLRTAFPNTYLNIFLVFFVGMSLATLLEYITASLLERVFKKQLWDYSTLKLTYKFTYKNRISLVSSLFFGLCSLFMSYFLYDIVDAFTLSFGFYTLVIINVLMVLLMGTDMFIQVHKQENTKKFIEKLSQEQLKEMLQKTLIQMGGTRQIREFREFREKSEALLKNIPNDIKNNIKSVNENINKNIKNVNENIKKLKGTPKK